MTGGAGTGSMGAGAGGAGSTATGGDISSIASSVPSSIAGGAPQLTQRSMLTARTETLRDCLPDSLIRFQTEMTASFMRVRWLHLRQPSLRHFCNQQTGHESDERERKFIRNFLSDFYKFVPEFSLVVDCLFIRLWRELSSWSLGFPISRSVCSCPLFQDSGKNRSQVSSLTFCYCWWMI